jgi:hypothetical protein
MRADLGQRYPSYVIGELDWRAAEQGAISESLVTSVTVPAGQRQGMILSNCELNEEAKIPGFADDRR